MQLIINTLCDRKCTRKHTWTNDVFNVYLPSTFALLSKARASAPRILLLSSFGMGFRSLVDSVTLKRKIFVVFLIRKCMGVYIVRYTNLLFVLNHHYIYNIYVYIGLDCSRDKE